MQERVSIFYQKDLGNTKLDTQDSLIGKRINRPKNNENEPKPTEGAGKMRARSFGFKVQAQNFKL